MDKYLTLTPAYGRDYKNVNQLLNDWDNNKDFIITLKNGQGATYINKSDFISLRDRHPIKTVEYIKFRYDNLQKVKVIKVVEETLTI